MQILKYVNYKLVPAEAKFYNNSVKGKDYVMYTVDIGSAGKGLWKYFMKLGHSVVDKQHPDTQKVILEGDNYTIRPIKDKDGNILKDALGNVRYKIEEDRTDAFKTDIILFIEIPNKNYTDVEYKLSVCATIIAKAFIGKERDSDKVIKSPALVLEITGDFSLSYTAKDQFSQTINGIYTFDYKTKGFDIKENIESKGE